MVFSWLVAIGLAGQLEPAALVPLYRQALANQEKQFGPDHPKVARSASDLGVYLRNIGDSEAAAEFLARALNIDVKTFGAYDPLVAQDLENLASIAPPERALQLYRKAAECADAEISARNWGKVGDLSAAGGDRKTATDAYRRALAKEEAASGADHPRIAVRLNDIAQVLEPKAAEPLVRRALAIETKSLGQENPATAITMNNLASVLLAVRKLSEAEALARQSMKILESTLGPTHPRIAVIASNLASILREKPDLAGARRAYSRALAIDQVTYGADHPEVAADLRNLAEVYSALGNKHEAKRLLDRAKAMRGK